MNGEWISPWWQAACLPDKWDVCGVITPSLTVWHVFALQNVGNAYVCGGGIDKDAAASLLLFASTDYRGGRKLLHMPNHRARRMRQMFRRLRNKSLEDIHAACSEYVESCMRGVSRWDRPNAKPGAVPYPWHMVVRLSGGDITKIEQAWNTPYAVARAICDTSAEANGDESIMQADAQRMEDNWGDDEQKAEAS